MHTYWGGGEGGGPGGGFRGWGKRGWRGAPHENAIKVLKIGDPIDFLTTSSTPLKIIWIRVCKNEQRGGGGGSFEKMNLNLRIEDPFFRFRLSYNLKKTIWQKRKVRFIYLQSFGIFVFWGDNYRTKERKKEKRKKES
jgi:hypothetical protein